MKKKMKYVEEREGKELKVLANIQSSQNPSSDTRLDVRELRENTKYSFIRATCPSTHARSPTCENTTQYN